MYFFSSLSAASFSFFSPFIFPSLSLTFYAALKDVNVQFSSRVFRKARTRVLTAVGLRRSKHEALALTYFEAGDKLTISRIKCVVY
jgi:hypothetical protein